MWFGRGSRARITPTSSISTRSAATSSPAWWPKRSARGRRRDEGSRHFARARGPGGVRRGIRPGGVRALRPAPAAAHHRAVHLHQLLTGFAMKNEKIYVTRPFLPPLEEFTPLLEQICESRWLTNNGPFHEELE